MTDKHISLEFAANWLCRMASIDGVVSARECNLLSHFAGIYNLDATTLIRKAQTYSKEVTIPEVEIIDSRELMGRKFEEFVVSLCSDKKRFSLLEWRGDKISGEIYALDSLLPDLKIRHKLEHNVVEYFVECKYRSILKNNTLDLTSQLGRYRRMSSAKHNSELFIALGVGGSPSAPAQFYIIPSRMIKRDAVLNLDNFSKCLCSTSVDSFHNYINHFFNKRVFRTDQ